MSRSTFWIIDLAASKRLIQLEVQDPNLEVPITYKVYMWPCMGIFAQNMALFGTVLTLILGSWNSYRLI